MRSTIRRGATVEPPATIISSPGDKAGFLLSLRDSDGDILSYRGLKPPATFKRPSGACRSAPEGLLCRWICSRFEVFLNPTACGL